MAFHNRGGWSYETFYMGSDDPRNYFSGPGWFWWSCAPGCLPDGEANGPFCTEEEAVRDAEKPFALDDGRRRCKTHGTVISSEDGQFDGTCGECESMSDFPDGAHDGPGPHFVEVDALGTGLPPDEIQGYGFEENPPAGNEPPGCERHGIPGCIECQRNDQ
jgi:hypothetical protein